MPGTSRVEARWKVRKAYEVARECETLKTRLACLNTEMQRQRDFVSRLEYLLHLRTEMIGDLHGRIDALRKQNRQLDAENGRLAEMVRLS